MNTKKFLLLLLICVPVFARAFPLYSPAWGFSLDPPEDYELSGGDGKNKFSFSTRDGLGLDIAVYTSFENPESLAQDLKLRIGSSGEINTFEYHGRRAALMELNFSMPGANSKEAGFSGWGLCVELERPGTDGNSRGASSPAIAAALAYGPASKPELGILHFSALDSFAPTEAERRYPGPVTDFAYPRETKRLMPLSGIDEKAWFFEEDAEASQAFIEREFRILSRYDNEVLWKEAWARYYRMIFRDSWARLSDAAFNVERKLNVPSRENRDFADQVLGWVQSFKYERDLEGSDFVNLVSAATEGRGDCDTRAMLWALILNQANIPACMMVSREYSHAMGLAELPGSGAKFKFEGKEWLVAETTAHVSTGLIAQEQSEIGKWLGITLDGF